MNAGLDARIATHLVFATNATGAFTPGPVVAARPARRAKGVGTGMGPLSWSRGTFGLPSRRIGFWCVELSMEAEPTVPGSFLMEESGIFVRIVSKLERTGHASGYIVCGPGYDTTEHPSLDEAKEAAEEERYQPFTTRVNPGWPPMPDIVTAWPLNLYVKETTWPHWRGSAT